MMVGPVLRAGGWPAVAGVTGVAVVVGGRGAAFPAAVGDLGAPPVRLPGEATS
jgi:hypothetical protein